MRHEPFSVSVTYETWDEESREAGDTDDKGYEYEDARMSLSDVVRELDNYGPFDEVQVMGTLLRAYVADADQNLRTGEDTMRAIHVRGSERAIRRLAAAYEVYGRFG